MACLVSTRLTSDKDRMMKNVANERELALSYAIRELRLPNLAVEQFVQGWLARAEAESKTYQEGLDKGWNDGFHAGLSERTKNAD